MTRSVPARSDSAPWARVRRPAVLLVATATAALLTAGVAVAPAARADSPQQQAARLAAQLATLRAEAEQATEAYDQVEEQLGQVVAATFTARQQVTSALAAAQAQAQQRSATVRQVYELGGPAALYVGILSHGVSPAQIGGQLQAVQRVLAANQATAAALNARSTAAMDAQRRADELAEQQTRLESQVAAKAAAVQSAISRTQSLLDSANAQVLTLEREAEQQAAAAQQAQFLQQLSAAGRYGAQLAGAPPAPSTQAAAALAAAEALQGHPYQWGGTGPVGYDCSGLTQTAYAAAGIRLPRTAAQQYLSGPHVPLASLEPGDLLFWASNPADPSTIDHVAIYAGKGLMVSANHTGDVVRLQPVWWTGYAGATRPAATAAA